MKKLLKIILLLLFIAAAWMFLKDDNEVVLPEPSPAVSEEPVVTLDNGMIEGVVAFPYPSKGNGLFGNYDCLSPDEQTLYVQILQKIADLNFTFTLDHVDHETYSKVITAIRHDYPELFWLTGGYKYQQSEWTSSSITVYMDTLIDEEKIPSMYGELMNALDTMTAQTAQYTSSFDLAVFVHDEIIRQCDYNLDAARAGDPDSLAPASTSYSSLVMRSPVCSGYAAGYQLVLRTLGIPCGRIRGTDASSAPHEWNYIIIEGEACHVDVTHDDPLSEDSSFISDVSHIYFGLTDEEILKTRTMDTDQYLPSCTDDSYNYFKYKGLFVNTYSFDTVKYLVENYSDNGNIQIRFSSTEEMQAALDDLSNELYPRIFEIYPYYNNEGHVSYSTHDFFPVLTLFYN